MSWAAASKMASRVATARFCTRRWRSGFFFGVRWLMDSLRCFDLAAQYSFKLIKISDGLFSDRDTKTDQLDSNDIPLSVGVHVHNTMIHRVSEARAEPYF